MPRAAFGATKSAPWMHCFQDATIVGPGRVRVFMGNHPTPLFECVQSEGQQTKFTWDVDAVHHVDVLRANDAVFMKGRAHGPSWVEYDDQQVAVLEEKWVMLR